jgi:ClpP class serine protease
MSRDERFPRSETLPQQSPLFWVEQKDRYLRQLLIRDIEAQTNRRLVVYFANRYQNAQIEPRDSTFITELLGNINSDPFDLLLETGGGMTDATESVVKLITNMNLNFRVIVAHSAKSNGTLLCLAAKSIVMGVASELGSIEPLINNIPCSILVQPQIAAQNFSLSKLGEFALQQTSTLAKSLLTNGMMSDRQAT